MGETKIQKADYLSKVLPQDDPSLRDLLNDIEPVHAAESGSFEKVRYDIPASKDGSSADSLQRSATRFKKRALATTLAKKVAKKSDGITYAQQSLEEYLAQQKFIKLQPSYHVVIQEYLERHLDKFPFMQAAFVKRLRENIFGQIRIISSSRHVDISEGKEKPETYRCLVMVPKKFLSALRKTQAYKNTLKAILYHEIEGHCRDFNPRSEFWRTMRKAGLVKQAELSAGSKWQDAIRPYLELSAQIMHVDFMMKELNVSKNPNAVIDRFQKATKELICEHAPAALMKLSFLDRKKRELVASFFKEQMRRTSKDTRDYFRKVLQEDCYLNDKTLSMIGL